MGMPILEDMNGPCRPGAGFINMNISADGTRVSAARRFFCDPHCLVRTSHSC